MPEGHGRLFWWCGFARLRGLRPPLCAWLGPGGGVGWGWGGLGGIGVAVGCGVGSGVWVWVGGGLGEGDWSWGWWLKEASVYMVALRHSRFLGGAVLAW